jgi:hypothetical protein
VFLTQRRGDAEKFKKKEKGRKKKRKAKTARRIPQYSLNPPLLSSPLLFFSRIPQRLSVSASKTPRRWGML